MSRIGILSFAHVSAPAYASCLRQLPGAELAGIADDDSSRGMAAAQQFGTSFFPSPEALLAASLDGVIITAENTKRLPLALLAARAGVHILCEEPIATTMAGGQEMIDHCRRAGVKLMIAFPYRYSPTMQAVSRLIENGQLGQVYGLTTTNRGWMPGGWFTNRDLAGGGAVLDHTVHVADLVRWFWGSEVKRVYAEIGRGLFCGTGIDDAGIITFELANGIIGTVDASWSRPEVFPIWGDVSMSIVAEAGILDVNMLAQTMDLYADREKTVSRVGWGSDFVLALVKDFVNVISGKRAPPITGEDGLRALEVALAAYRAAETGLPVDLPLS